MPRRPGYRVKSRRSYQFFKMNNEQKEILKKVLDRRHRIQELREATGAEDEQALQVLEGCGIDPSCVNLVLLVPLLEVAWADGEVLPREEQLLRAIAAERGIEEGSRAAELFERWLRRRPADAVFDACDQVVAAMIEHLPADERRRATEDLEHAIHAVAEIAGGVFGLFATVSDREREVIGKMVELLHDGQGTVDAADEVTIDDQRGAGAGGSADDDEAPPADDGGTG